MAIGVILLAVAVFLAFESYSLLLGETAPRDVESKIRGVVSREPAVDGLEALHTMHVGTDSLLIALSVATTSRPGRSRTPYSGCSRPSATSCPARPARCSSSSSPRTVGRRDADGPELPSGPSARGLREPYRFDSLWRYTSDCDESGLPDCQSVCGCCRRDSEV